MNLRQYERQNKILIAREANISKVKAPPNTAARKTVFRRNIELRTGLAEAWSACWTLTYRAHLRSVKDLVNIGLQSPWQSRTYPRHDCQCGVGKEWPMGMYVNLRIRGLRLKIQNRLGNGRYVLLPHHCPASTIKSLSPLFQYQSYS